VILFVLMMIAGILTLAVPAATSSRVAGCIAIRPDAIVLRDYSDLNVENGRRLIALLPFCSTCQFAMTIPADPATIPVITDGITHVRMRRQAADYALKAVPGTAPASV